MACNSGRFQAAHRIYLTFALIRFIHNIDGHTHSALDWVDNGEREPVEWSERKCRGQEKCDRWGRRGKYRVCTMHRYDLDKSWFDLVEFANYQFHLRFCTNVHTRITQTGCQWPATVVVYSNGQATNQTIVSHWPSAANKYIYIYI